MGTSNCLCAADSSSLADISRKPMSARKQKTGADHSRSNSIKAKGRILALAHVTWVKIIVWREGPLLAAPCLLAIRVSSHGLLFVK